MVGFKTPLWATALATLVATSCVSTRPVHYYTLAPNAAIGNAAKPDGPTLLVGLITALEPLQDARIRYRLGSNETGAYEYQRWTEHPGAMVRDSLVRALRSSGKYQRVLEPSSAAVGDYLVRGKLYEFAEVDQPAIHTQISLQLELVDKKTNRSVWDHMFEREEPANGKQIQDVVHSMDNNLQQVVTGAAAEIGRFLAEQVK